MSKQHVLPDRLKHVAPRKHGVRQHGVRSRTVTEDGSEKFFERKRSNEGSIGNSTVRKVCIDCNTGWLERMEADCVPVLEDLISGEKTKLYLPQQRKLARLAISMSMAGEWLQPDYVRVTQDERTQFMETQEPPRNWTVYVGRDVTGEDNTRILTDGCGLSDDDGADGPRLYATTTITVGQVLLHVVAPADDFSLVPHVYSRQLGLAAIHPAKRWIEFSSLPPLGIDNIIDIRDKIRLAVRQQLGHG